MSKFRPTLRNAAPGTYCPGNGTAYLMILHAVRERPGLIHGKLQSGGEYCAIGSFFHTNARSCLLAPLIDEVAAVNDSLPSATPMQRKRAVMRWLRWRLAQCGMPGFGNAAGAKEPR